MLHLEKDAWSMFRRLREATNECAPCRYHLGGTKFRLPEMCHAMVIHRCVRYFSHHTSIPMKIDPIMLTAQAGEVDIIKAGGGHVDGRRQIESKGRAARRAHRA